jgi:hypothetical protein
MRLQPLALSAIELYQLVLLYQNQRNFFFGNGMKPLLRARRSVPPSPNQSTIDSPWPTEKARQLDECIQAQM